MKSERREKCARFLIQDREVPHQSPSPTILQTSAPRIAPNIGASQNSQSCENAAVSAKNTTPVERAGFSDVLVIGMETRLIAVRLRPMTAGARSADARRWGRASGY